MSRRTRANRQPLLNAQPSPFTNPYGSKKKIFINYSSTDNREDALKLYNFLSKYKQLEVWMDKKNLQGGLKWRPKIRKVIRESDFFLALLSKSSIKGRGQRNWEIRLALEVLAEFPPNAIYLIPIRLDDCEPPFEEMHELDCIDLFPDWNTGLKKLADSIGIN